MDTEIREAIARSLPDLALIVRRDGIILSCVGGQAFSGINANENEITGRATAALGLLCLLAATCNEFTPIWVMATLAASFALRGFSQWP